MRETDTPQAEIRLLDEKYGLSFIEKYILGRVATFHETSEGIFVGLDLKDMLSIIEELKVTE